MHVSFGMTGTEKMDMSLAVTGKFHTDKHSKQLPRCEVVTLIQLSPRQLFTKKYVKRKLPARNPQAPVEMTDTSFTDINRLQMCAFISVCILLNQA